MRPWLSSKVFRGPTFIGCLSTDGNALINCPPTDGVANRILPTVEFWPICIEVKLLLALGCLTKVLGYKVTGLTSPVLGSLAMTVNGFCNCDGCSIDLLLTSWIGVEVTMPLDPVIFCTCIGIPVGTTGLGLMLTGVVANLVAGCVPSELFCRVSFNELTNLNNKRSLIFIFWKSNPVNYCLLTV